MLLINVLREFQVHQRLRYSLTTYSFWTLKAISMLVLSSYNGLWVNNVGELVLWLPPTVQRHALGVFCHSLLGPADGLVNSICCFQL